MSLKEINLTELPGIVKEHYKNKIAELKENIKRKLLKMKESFTYENLYIDTSIPGEINNLVEEKIKQGKYDIEEILDEYCSGKILNKEVEGVELPTPFFIKGFGLYEQLTELVESYNKELTVLIKERKEEGRMINTIARLLLDHRELTNPLDNIIKNQDELRVVSKAKQKLAHELKLLEEKCFGYQRQLENNGTIYKKLEQELGKGINPNEINIKEELLKKLEKLDETNPKKKRTHEKKIRCLIDNTKGITKSYKNCLEHKKECEEKIAECEERIKENKKQTASLDHRLRELNLIEKKNEPVIKTVQKQVNEIIRIRDYFEEKYELRIKDVIQIIMLQ